MIDVDNIQLPTVDYYVPVKEIKYDIYDDDITTAELQSFLVAEEQNNVRKKK